MSNKQDRQGVRTAADLERKYQFYKQFQTFNGFAHESRESINDVAQNTSALAQHTDRTYTPLVSFNQLSTQVGQVGQEVIKVQNSLGDYTPRTSFTDLSKEVDNLIDSHNALSREVTDLEGKHNTLSGTVNNIPTFTSGESDGWYYRKWSDGRAECWKTLTHSTNITVEWGALYHGTSTIRQTYPFSFVDKPVETVSLTAGSYQAILFPEKNGNGVNGASASACYNVCRPSSITSSVTFYINFYVQGKWK